MIRLALIASVFALAPAWASEPVGLLSRVSGSVQIVRAGQRAAAAARTAELVFAGDRLTTERGSEAVVLFCPQSKSVTLTAGSELVFEPAALRVTRGKLSGERLVGSCRLPTSIALAAASRQQSGMMRLRGPNLLLRAPSRSAVATLRPHFYWDPVDNARGYDIRVMNREERILWRDTVTSTEAPYPEGAPALEWGQKYWWRVAARDGEDTLGEVGSWFQILPAGQADSVRSTEADLRRLLDENPADNGPRFLLAFLYDENGILHEAARTYGDLAERMGAHGWVQTRLTELMNQLGWDSPDRRPGP